MGKISSIQGLDAIAGRVAGHLQPEGRAPLWELLGAGQMLEISGHSPGKLSTVTRLLVRAQAEGDPCAWVSLREEACFYPPDLAQAGVDLSALAVVRIPVAAGPYGVVRAAELLLRSGAFGLVVLDFSHGVPKGELAWQSRLSGLVRMHDARGVLLTPSTAQEPSVGPMVSLRVEPEWRAQASELGSRANPRAPDFGPCASTRVLLTQRVLKCKLGGSVSVSPDVREPPRGAVRLA